MGIEPHSGNGTKAQDLESMPITPAWNITPVAGVKQTTDEGVLRVDFLNPGDLNYYQAGVQVNVKPNTSYRLSGWVKTEDMPAGNGASFQIGDSRGWLVTHSAMVAPSITGTTTWKRIEVVYKTLPDTTAVQILARRLSGTGAVHGTAWYKNLTLTRIIPKSLASVPVLTVSASRNANGAKIYLIVTNKDLHHAVGTRIVIKGFKAIAAKAWSLTGPSVDATNEADPDRVGIHPIPASADRIDLPPCSVSAIEIDGRVGA
jgi:hypothetical protein